MEQARVTWPANDPTLALLTKWLGEGVAYEKLERSAICAAEPDVPLSAPRVVYGEWEYREALRAWRPECEMMPVRGYTA